MAVFFTSDLHFGHQNILKYTNRPWDSVPEMNQGLVDRWNSVVTDTDTVICLGDLAMGKINETVPLSAELNGYKVLVPGNHDRVWSQNPKRDKFMDLYRDAGWDFWPEQMTYLLHGNLFLLCHFPYEGDSHEEDRYEELRPEDTGLPLLCGHVHDAWHTKGHMFNVGVDVNDWYPVAADTIISWAVSLQE